MSFTCKTFANHKNLSSFDKQLLMFENEDTLTSSSTPFCLSPLYIYIQFISPFQVLFLYLSHELWELKPSFSLLELTNLSRTLLVFVPLIHFSPLYFTLEDLFSLYFMVMTSSLYLRNTVQCCRLEMSLEMQLELGIKFRMPEEDNIMSRIYVWLIW